ncbi:hypothetical protein KBC04_03715 [Candidatus Babeliales bacterium]|nr:hypothetical protein [Candidatus Babeliales bacterium]MBP9844175.1 hypothetical protein [Candidatus Babeliales bacterium]
MNKQHMLITIFFCFLSVHTSNIISSSKKHPVYADLKNLIIYEPTESLVANLNSLQIDFTNMNVIKQELLMQNELDVFSRKSIKEVFKAKKYSIRALLCQRLITAEGERFKFNPNYVKNTQLQSNTLALKLEVLNIEPTEPDSFLPKIDGPQSHRG